MSFNLCGFTFKGFSLQFLLLQGPDNLCLCMFISQVLFISTLLHISLNINTVLPVVHAAILNSFMSLVKVFVDVAERLEY